MQLQNNISIVLKIQLLLEITKVNLGTSRAHNNYKGEILVPFADPQNSYMELLSKQTVFHEIGHSLETSRKANLNMAVNWSSTCVSR